jgi:hypothetical protein
MFDHLESYRPQTKLPSIFEENPNTRYIISPVLKSEIEQAQPGWEDDTDHLIAADWMCSIQSQVIRSLDRLPHPYHNGNHTVAVMRRALTYVGAKSEYQEKLDLVKLAALFHDYEHIGKGIRQIVCPEDSRSNEEVAVQKFDSICGPKLTLRQRLEAQGLILSTSFGQNNPATLPPRPELHLLRPYGPHTELENLFQFADIAGFDDEPYAFLVGGLGVTQEMVGVGNPLPGYDQFIKGQLGFLGYLRVRFAQVQESFGEEDRERLAQRLGLVETELTKIQAAEETPWSGLVRTLYDQACKYGIRL